MCLKAMFMSFRAPKIQDVAQLAGVSTATVSYVLNRIDRTSEETRQRVLEAVNQLGYVPNQTARNLRRKQAEQVCLVIPRLGLTYFDALAEDLQEAADQMGFSLVITVGGSLEREQRVVEQLRRGLAAGVIFRSYFLDVVEMTLLAQSGVAVVVISNFINSAHGFDVIHMDDFRGCYDAVIHLVKQGHRRIVFLGNLEDRSMHHDRLKAYTSALEDTGVPVDDSLIFRSVRSRTEAYLCIRSCLNDAKPFTAVFAASDTLAISAVWAARDAGLRIPDQVAVIGVGNHPEGQIMMPALSTVGSELPEHRDAVALLLSQLSEGTTTAGRIQNHAWQFIERGTT